MGLKEKLESLNNTQIYALWDYWISQNAEHLNEKQMISELLDVAMCDADSETELLSDVADIDNLCKPKPETQYYVSECPETHQQFLVQTGKDGNIIELTSDNICGMGLLPFLKEQYDDYQKNILPHDDLSSDNEADFDDAKNEFLESLWDVINQHFDDANPEYLTGPDGINPSD